MHFLTRFLTVHLYIIIEAPVQKTGRRVDGGGSRKLRRRLINNKLVAVNFLTNDLSFYLETEK